MERLKAQLHSVLGLKKIMNIIVYGKHMRAYTYHTIALVPGSHKLGGGGREKSLVNIAVHAQMIIYGYHIC